MKPKRLPIKVKTTVKLKAYALLSDRLERAVTMGIARARKYSADHDRPSDELLQDHIDNEIALALDELVEWE